MLFIGNFLPNNSFGSYEDSQDSFCISVPRIPLSNFSRNSSCAFPSNFRRMASRIDLCRRSAQEISQNSLENFSRDSSIRFFVMNFCVALGISPGALAGVFTKKNRLVTPKVSTVVIPTNSTRVPPTIS